MKKVLFIANTLYQAIVSMYIRESFYKDDCAYLFICSETKRLNELARNEYLKTIFNNVSLVEYDSLYNFEHMDGIKGHYRHMRRIINPQWFLKTLGCNIEMKYDEMFFYVPGRCFKDIYKCSISNNANMKLHCYQHGVETYLGSDMISGMHRARDTFFDKLYEYINSKKFGFNIEDLNFDIFCFQPELMPSTEKRRCIEIPNNHWTKEIKERINIALNYKSEYKIDERFVFFEQASEYIYDTDSYLELIKTISDSVGVENLIVKKHPRMQLKTKSNIRIYPGKEAWEEYLLNNEIFDKVLITVSSSAVATADYMFGQKCAIIYCFNLLKGKMSEEVMRYTSFLEDTKRRNNNIYIPDTIEDLRTILLSLK